MRSQLSDVIDVAPTILEAAGLPDPTMVYHRGWSAVTEQRAPWVMVGGEMAAFDDDVWEPYDGNSDDGQARNLAELSS